MNSCLDRLLSINDPCGVDSCMGIYDITDVIGFTWNKAAGIAEGNFKEYTGYQIAQKVRRISAKTVMSDIMAAMGVKGWATYLTAGQHDAGNFKTNTPAGSTSKRGIQITAKSKCAFSGLKLLSISVKGCTDITTNLVVQINTGTAYSFPITLKANQVFTTSSLCTVDGSNIFATEAGVITIWIEDENFHPYEVKPTCPTCPGASAKERCATSKGWVDNGITIKENEHLAYGITAMVACECDYDKILCALPNDEYKAQIMKYQASIQLARLSLETERFNYFTIYGREELLQYIAIAQNGYTKRINEYVNSLEQWFKVNQYCGCVVCHGSKTMALV